LTASRRKTTIRFCKGLAKEQPMGAREAFGVLGLVAALALASPSRAGPAQAGLVEEVSGSATAASNQKQRPLAPHDDVFIGDDVATAALSRARLALGHDTVVRLGENASLRIDKYLLDAGGVLTVGAGALLLDKTPSKGPTRLRGAFGLISVRGTRVFAGPSKGVIGVLVVHGLVDLKSGGVTVTLHDGEGSDIAQPGARPTPPKTWGAARVQAALASVE
jgi:FecR protein